MDFCIGHQLLPNANSADRGGLREEYVGQHTHVWRDSLIQVRVPQRLEQVVLRRRHPCFRQEVYQRSRNSALQSCIRISFSLSAERDEATGEGEVTPRVRDALLCLSNGHGEDTIAVAILKCLQVISNADARPTKIDALPLVGLGNAYKAAGISVIGPSQAMPSGGFLYMDRRQLVGDVQAGLLQLTVDQWKAIAEWSSQNPGGVILAVGDIFPLAMSWLASRKMRAAGRRDGLYAFVGTAKSDLYLRDEEGEALKGHGRPFLERLLSPKGVHLPWERALMAAPACKLVATRDSLTRDILCAQLPQAQQHKVKFLGNPMMDGLEASGALSPLLSHIPADHCVVLLPGSRPPEVYSNFELLLACCEETAVCVGPATCLFLAPLIPSIPHHAFFDALRRAGWQQEKPNAEALSVELSSKHKTNRDAATPSHPSPPWFLFTKSFVSKASSGNGSESTCHLAMVPGGFCECIHAAQAGIAMAGTATEQLVGLGRPVFSLPGAGPQFTYQFAEAQSRLLGKSVVLCDSPNVVAMKLSEFLRNPSLANEFHENGFKRMGGPGGAKSVATEIWARCLRGESITTLDNLQHATHDRE